MTNKNNRAVPEEFVCIDCAAKFPVTECRYRCDCGALLAVQRPLQLFTKVGARTFDVRYSDCGVGVAHQSGVWRFREFVMDVEDSDIVSHPEGRTRLYQRGSLSTYAGVNQLYFKHEGENPTGSFKDRGMTVAVTHAKKLGMRRVVCASTGNTSASLASYAAQAGMDAWVMVPEGKISTAKLAQTLAYGAQVVQVRGDFDAAMGLVEKAGASLGMYVVNSVNPYRIEGQKTIIWEMLDDMNWAAPDWIVVPAGNLGNTSAFGKALQEAMRAGWIGKMPRIASIQAAGANPFFRSLVGGFGALERVQSDTIASAIRIGDPVNYSKAMVAIRETKGVVEQVTDAEILEAKAAIDASGIGCEPASAATLAGLIKLRQAGVIKPAETVVCVLTGHILKDPDAIVGSGKSRYFKRIHVIDPTLAALEKLATKPL